MRPLPIAILLWTLARVAAAEPVRFDWTGTVSFADPALAGAGIVVGTPAAGNFRFESAVTDAEADPSLGLYEDALLRWQVAVGTLEGNTSGQGFGQIAVDLDFGAGSHVYQVDADPDLFLRLTDTDGTAFASDALPASPPDLSAFEAAAFVRLDPDTQQPLLVVAIESLVLVPPAVPGVPVWARGALLLGLLLATRRLLSLPAWGPPPAPV